MSVFTIGQIEKKPIFLCGMMGFFDIMRLSLAQYILGFVGAGLFALKSSEASLSALVGGMSYAIPTSVVALMLWIFSKVSKKGSIVVTMFVLFGELLKVLLCILILWCVAVNFNELEWLPLLTNLIMVSFGSFFVLIKRK